MKLVLQLEKEEGEGNLSKIAFPRFDPSAVQPCNFVVQAVQLKKGRLPRRYVSGESRGKNCKALSFRICFINSRHGSPCAQTRGVHMPCVAVGLLAYTCLREDAVGSSGADGSTQRFLACYTSSVCQAACYNRSKACPRNSAQEEDDWERGITQSCLLLSQDHENLMSQLENSLSCQS